MMSSNRFWSHRRRNSSWMVRSSYGSPDLIFRLLKKALSETRTLPSTTMWPITPLPASGEAAGGPSSDSGFPAGVVTSAPGAGAAGSRFGSCGGGGASEGGDGAGDGWGVGAGCGDGPDSSGGGGGVGVGDGSPGAPSVCGEGAASDTPAPATRARQREPTHREMRVRRLTQDPHRGGTGTLRLVGEWVSAGGRNRFPERQPLLIDEDLDLPVLGELPENETLRQSILNILLDGTAERARAVGTITARRGDEPAVRLVGQRQPNPPFGQAAIELADHQADDRQQILVRQRVEHDDLVDAVDELRVQNDLDFLEDQLPALAIIALAVVGGVEPHGARFLDQVRADVRGHDDQAILEVNGVPERVGDLAVLQHLEENVEHVGMRLLDLVQEDDAVGPSLDPFGELAPLFVADVPRRRTDHLGDGVLLHVLRHVESDERFLVAEQELGQSLGDLRLADARRTEEDERTDGPPGALQTGALPPRGAGQGGDRFILTHDPLVQKILHLEEPLRLLLLHGGDRDASPFRDDFLDVLLRHLEDGASFLFLAHLELVVFL